MWSSAVIAHPPQCLTPFRDAFLFAMFTKSGYSSYRSLTPLPSLINKKVFTAAGWRFFVFFPHHSEHCVTATSLAVWITE